jgi:hypothetical protein
MRKVFIGGNWKCNNTLPETQSMIGNVIDKLEFDHNKVGKIFYNSRCCCRPNLFTPCYSSFH